jgi:microsomal dipeptidase-like Zn-dependent dipeptidase
MNSLSELTGSCPKPCSFRKWANDRKIPKEKPLSLRQLMSAYTPPSLWGFADLHAHPAAHLAFGADKDGNDGIFWGKPATGYLDKGEWKGLKLEESLIDQDLSSCDADQHSGFEPDFVRHAYREEVIKGAEKLISHNKDGWPTFNGWPHASSLIHQQMHISSIYRAWQGGMRVMIASVTDNQLLSKVWTRGITLDNSWPFPEGDFDFKSAKRQLEFIHKLVENNNSWMEIALNAAHAGNIVRANKLAVILGVEMDTLTPEQIITLKTSLGVSQVVPIHLANNDSFGGVAVYDDSFNTNNWYLHGGQCSDVNGDHHLDLFFHVKGDPFLSFKLNTLSLFRWDEIPGNDNGKILKFLAQACNIGMVETENMEKIDDKTIKIPFKRVRSDGHAHHYTIKCYVLLQLNDEKTKVSIIENDNISYRFSAKMENGKLTVFSKPQYLCMETLGALKPEYVSDSDYDALAYSRIEGGHRNQLGLNKPEFFKLMRAGLIIDLAHMSEESQKDALDLADPIGYPLMNSHGGIRPNECNDMPSERDMPKSLLEKLTSKGGVFGIGTSGYRNDKGELEQWIRNYFDIWNAMHFRGVALGTDFNGLSPQIPNSSKPVQYDDNPLSPDPSISRNNFLITKIKKSSMGNRSFDFTNDGLAHYGMLADFIQALRKFDEPGTPYQGADIANHFLFRTAEDTIRMWEKVELASKRF